MSANRDNGEQATPGRPRRRRTTTAAPIAPRGKPVKKRYGQMQPWTGGNAKPIGRAAREGL